MAQKVLIFNWIAYRFLGFSFSEIYIYIGFIYLVLYIMFSNFVSVILSWVVEMIEESSTYRWSGLWTINNQHLGKQLPAFPIEFGLGFEFQSQG